MEIRGADAAGQLSVRERTGAALAELDVGFGIQNSVGRHPFHIRGALRDGTAPFNQHRIRAGTGQHEGGKKPRGAGTDHQRRSGEAGNRQGKAGNAGNRGKKAALLQKRLFIFNFEVHSEHKAYIAFIAGIDRPLCNGAGKEPVRRDAAFFRDGGPQGFLRIVRRKGKIGETQHGSVLLRFMPAD